MSDGTTSIADRVRGLRRRRALTQEELAERAGLSLTVVKKIERGGTARMETYHQLARALGVTTVWFVSAAPPEPAEHSHDELALAEMRSAVSPPISLTGRTLYGTADADTADLTRLAAAINSVAAAYHADRYDDLAVFVPALVRSAHHHVDHYDDGSDRLEALRLRADITGLAGRYLIQVRAHDLALTALHSSLRDAVEIGDVPLAAAAVSSQAWAMMRQGRLEEVERLCVVAADEIEPKMSTATPEQLSAWGYLLMRAAGAASRNNRPAEARELAAIAHTAGSRLQTQHHGLPGHKTFGPLTTALAGVEVEMVDRQPERALELSQSIPREVGRTDASTWHRHRLDVAAALVETGDPAEAAGIMTQLRVEHPEWLRYQQYGRDIVRKILALQPRTLTEDQRSLADFMNVEG